MSRGIAAERILNTNFMNSTIKTLIIASLIVMVFIYLMISFAMLDLNFKNWTAEARTMYAVFAPITTLIFTPLFIIVNELHSDRPHKGD